MANTPNFKIGCQANQIKVISASNWPCTLGADGAFVDQAASYISNNDDLTLGSDRDIMIIDGNDSFNVTFTSSDNLGYPLGMKIPIGFSSVEIKSVSSDVFVLRLIFQTMNTKIQDAFTDTNKETAVTSMMLYPGDIVVTKDNISNYFGLEFSFDPSLRYSKTGFDIINLSNANP